MAPATSASSLSARAERYVMELPLRYHLPELGKWADARTVNVSHTGVLARLNVEGLLPAGHVEFVLALPRCGIVPLAQIRCTGRLVRVDGRRSEAVFALSIDRYRFVKPNERDVVATLQ